MRSTEDESDGALDGQVMFEAGAELGESDDEDEVERQRDLRGPQLVRLMSGDRRAR